MQTPTDSVTAQPPGDSQTSTRYRGEWTVTFLKILAWANLVADLAVGIVLLFHVRSAACSYDEYFAQLCSNATKGKVLGWGIGLVGGAFLGFALFWTASAAMEHLIAVRRLLERRSGS